MSDLKDNIDSEVRPRATRRRFTLKYKIKILRQADQCVETGEIGALLRREGLYSSQLAQWRKQRTQGHLDESKPKVGRDPSKKPKQMEAEISRLREQLEKAREVIDVQKKLCNLLDLSSENTEEI